MSSTLEKCRNCAARGLTQQQAADEIGVSKQRISQIAKAHDIVFGVHKTTRDRIDWAEVDAMIGSGAGTQEIADRFGAHVRNMHILLRQRGLKVRHHRRTDIATEAEIVRRLRAGDRQVDIAADLNVSQERVSAVGLRHGLRRTLPKGAVLRAVQEMAPKGYTAAEIAEAVGTSHNTVCNTIWRLKNEGRLQ